MSRNSIRAEPAGTTCDCNDIRLLVDGCSFDILLDDLAPDRDLKELIPTMVGCFEETEHAVVLQRILPAAGVTTVAPILMCPEDRDFSCLLVVVEAVGSHAEVEWRRVGIDRSEWDPDPQRRVGENVEWLAGAGPFLFDRKEYTSAMSAFNVTLSDPE